MGKGKAKPKQGKQQKQSKAALEKAAKAAISAVAVWCAAALLICKPSSSDWASRKPVKQGAMRQCWLWQVAKATPRHKDRRRAALVRIPAFSMTDPAAEQCRINLFLKQQAALESRG